MSGELEATMGQLYNVWCARQDRSSQNSEINKSFRELKGRFINMMQARQESQVTFQAGNKQIVFVIKEKKGKRSMAQLDWLRDLYTECTNVDDFLLKFKSTYNDGKLMPNLTIL